MANALLKRGDMQRAALVLILLVSSYAHAATPIVGGSRVSWKEWPDVVGVIGAGGRCTGTLVAPDVVLTAGHCIDLEPHTVVTHADDLGPGASGQRIAVKWSRAYPNWAERYDIGVVVLEHVARTPPRAIASACVLNKALPHAAVTIVGFGLISPEGDDANTRLHAASIGVTDAFCTGSPGCLASARPNGEFAAGGRGTDSCFGDSGGPAYLRTPAGTALAGVVSRGLDVIGPPCSNGGIYVRADKVVAWIESVTERDLTRMDCPRPADEPGADEEETDGCASHRGGSWASALVLLALLAVKPAASWRRSR